MHLKRQKVPKNWPIFRKGTKYIVRPGFDPQRGVPVLIILRDMLKIAQNRKETKRAIHMKHVLVNNKPVIDERNNVLLLDTLTLVPLKKHYRLGLSKNGKFEINEIKEDEARYKVAKIINKKVLKGRKTQLNLSDGRNFLSDIKCNTDDSVLIDFKNKKIEKCVPLKERSKVIVFAGKHSGKTGIIKKVDLERKMTKLETKEGPINVLIKQILVVG